MYMLGKLYPHVRETWKVEGMGKRKAKLARNMRHVTEVLFGEGGRTRDQGGKHDT